MNGRYLRPRRACMCPVIRPKVGPVCAHITPRSNGPISKPGKRDPVIPTALVAHLFYLEFSWMREVTVMEGPAYLIMNVAAQITGVLSGTATCTNFMPCQ